MKCPTCGEPSIRERVQTQCISVRKFTDEHGEHVHDPNKKCRVHECASGHRWWDDEQFYLVCQCGWTAG